MPKATRNGLLCLSLMVYSLVYSWGHKLGLVLCGVFSYRFTCRLVTCLRQGCAVGSFYTFLAISLFCLRLDRVGARLTPVPFGFCSVHAKRQGTPQKQGWRSVSRLSSGIGSVSRRKLGCLRLCQAYRRSVGLVVLLCFIGLHARPNGAVRLFHFGVPRSTSEQPGTQ